MSGRHCRPAAAPAAGLRLRTLGGAGLAGVAAFFAAAPAALAGTASPTPASASPDPSTDALTTDSPSTDAPSTDEPSAPRSSSAPSTSTAPSTPAPSPSPSDRPASTHPVTPTKPKVQAAPVKQLSVDAGTGKIRVGVQLKDGSWVPPGTTTAGTEITIVESGPTSPHTTTCRTQASTATAGSSATFCTFTTPAVMRPDIVVEPPTFPPPGSPGEYYVVAPGDTVTVRQTSVNANLVADPDTGTASGCAGPCFGFGGLIFEDAVTPPVAEDDHAVTGTGRPVAVNALANDVTLGAPASISSVSDPRHGSARIVVPSSGAPHLLYTPDAGFAGTDTFDYVLSTPNGQSTATVTIRVVAPPTARDDSATTPAGTPVTVRVLANDDAHGGGSLHLLAVGDPAHGTARIAGSHVVYTPATGFVGTDTFTYTAATAFGQARATVTVRVTAPVQPNDTDDTNLANTGVPTEELLELGGVLLAGGGAATIAGRRRRPRRRHA